MSLAVFKLIPGKFVVVGYQPDGDSVRFIADNPNDFQELYRGHLIKPSTKDGSVQLRFDCVDTPELHYGSAEQPEGATARDGLLKKMGFGKVTYGPGKKEATGAENPEVPGAILTSAAEPHGRPISYVLFADDAKKLKEQYVDVDEAVLARTMNHYLLESGLAYPLFYTSAPGAHRAYFKGIAEKARTSGLGVWSKDSSGSFPLETAKDIGPEGALIFPKLFRRATDYLKDVAAHNFAGNLAEWIVWTSRGENDEVMLPGGVHVHFAELIKQRNKNVSLQGDVMEMVFIER